MPQKANQPTNQQDNLDQNAADNTGADDQNNQSDQPEQAQPPRPVGRGGGVAAKAQATNKSSAGVKDSTPSPTDEVRAVKEKLALEPKVSYIIPLQFGERMGAEESVTINGYRLVIKKGVRVELPMTVAKMLDQYLNIQNEVGLDLRIDLSEEKEKKLG